MQLNRLPRSSGLFALALAALLVTGCTGGGGGGGGGSDYQDIPETTKEVINEFLLVWSDEFNTGTFPSAAYWNVETGYGSDGDGWGNNESQLYTADPANLRVENGHLVITAMCDAGLCRVRDGSITSARINSKDKFEAMAIMAGYDLSEEKAYEIRQALDARRGARETPA